MRVVVAWIVFSLISTSALAEWANPADRYSDAYKKYQGASSPIAPDSIRNFVYFARERDAIRDHSFLNINRFVGAQIMYAWAQLEPAKDRYDFSTIREDYLYLQSKGKRLFIQLQDATFDPRNKGVPDYLLGKDYQGGVERQLEDDGQHFGWVAKRWNPPVQERFASLLSALGKEFDGKIEGINLQETAVGVTADSAPSFSPSLYAESLKANMLAMKKAFPRSTTMQYANFMPGEWLPWDDKGFLRSIYGYGEKIGVGLGAPDLMPSRKGQLNHALALMHEKHYQVPLGIAVQDGNYVGQTNSTEVVSKRKNIVPILHSFALDFLRVNYMFWSNQSPYFEEDVLPAFSPR